MNEKSKRGGFRGGVKPTLPENQKKRGIYVRIRPDLREWIDAQPEGPTALIEAGLSALMREREARVGRNSEAY